jgi:hypothetical protein
VSGPVNFFWDKFCNNFFNWENSTIFVNYLGKKLQIFEVQKIEKKNPGVDLLGGARQQSIQNQTIYRN